MLIGGGSGLGALIGGETGLGIGALSGAGTVGAMVTVRKDAGLAAERTPVFTTR